jgi:hypothetical protein
LPSSLTRVLPIALVFSTCPPVSVLVRARATSLDAFLGGMASSTSLLVGARHPVSGLMGDGFSYRPPYAVTPGRPRLRSRLTLSRLALLRNPWAFGGGVSHPSFVTRASILTSHPSTASFRCRFARMGTLPYHSSRAEVRGFGFVLEPRYIVRARPLDQ